MSSTENHLMQYKVRDGEVVKLADLIDNRGLTDVDGNHVDFSNETLPQFYREVNGVVFSVSASDLKNAPVTLHIQKLPEQSLRAEEKQEKEPNALSSTTRITSKSKQIK
jgi:hypothetical protein